MDNQLIFFVEDEPEITEFYTNALKEANFTVETKDTGRGALDRIIEFENENRIPEFVILDILLPDISGLEALNVIRRKDSFKNTPVIMLTNYSSEKLRNEINDMPNTRYLLKESTPPKELVVIVKSMLSL